MSAMTELVNIRQTKVRRTSKPSKAERREGRAAYLFLAPWFVGLALITIGPMVASFGLSFTRLQPAEPAEVDRLRELHADADRRAARHLAAGDVQLRVHLAAAAARGRAVPRDRARPGPSRPRVLPVGVLPALAARGSVAIAILWRQIFGVDGLVNSGARRLRHRGAGLDLQPRHRARHADDPERLDVRLADGHLPRRAPPDPHHVLRGGRRRRRQPRPAALPDHDPAADPDHLLQRRCSS